MGVWAGQSVGLAGLTGHGRGCGVWVGPEGRVGLKVGLKLWDAGRILREVLVWKGLAGVWRVWSIGGTGVREGLEGGVGVLQNTGSVNSYGLAVVFVLLRPAQQPQEGAGFQATGWVPGHTLCTV